jgi:hypothetical protein
METLYSLILWDKMKRTPNEFPIHKKELSEIETEFKKHIENVSPEQFKEDVRENSFLDIQKNDLYYDGQFYEFNDSHHKSVVQPDPKDEDRFLVKSLYHETMVESTILSLMMEHLGPDSSEFLARVHRAWFEKKNSTNHQEK